MLPAMFIGQYLAEYLKHPPEFERKTDWRWATSIDVSGSIEKKWLGGFAGSKSAAAGCSAYWEDKHEHVEFAGYVSASAKFHPPLELLLGPGWKNFIKLMAAGRLSVIADVHRKKKRLIRARPAIEVTGEASTRALNVIAPEAVKRLPGQSALDKLRDSTNRGLLKDSFTELSSGAEIGWSPLNPWEFEVRLFQELATGSGPLDFYDLSEKWNVEARVIGVGRRMLVATFGPKKPPPGGGGPAFLELLGEALDPYGRPPDDLMGGLGDPPTPPTPAPAVATVAAVVTTPAVVVAAAVAPAIVPAIAKLIENVVAPISSPKVVEAVATGGIVGWLGGLFGSGGGVEVKQ